MPMTSSRFWSITGKSECAVAMICGMNFSTGSWMSMKSTCARGIMMSRTCISETVSAPSMIDRASASSRLRAYAERSRRVSSPRSPGSRRMSADRRSSSLGRLGSFIRGGISFYRVGVAESQAPQQADLARFHARCIPFLFMVVSAGVQRAVNHQMRVMRAQRFAQLLGFLPDHGIAEHHVSRMERQHVRRFVLAPVSPVQEKAFLSADDPQRDSGELGPPAAKGGDARHAPPLPRDLDLEAILAASASRRHR